MDLPLPSSDLKQAMKPSSEPIHISPSQASLASTVVSEDTVTLNESSVQNRKILLRQQTSNVSFGSVQVREFNRTVGDHPDVTRGAPMTLDWDYHEHDHMDLMQFETIRSQQRKRFLRLPAARRTQLLKNEFHASSEELIQAEQQVQVIKLQRAESQNDTDSVWDKIERKPRRNAKQVAVSRKTGQVQGKKGIFRTIRKALSVNR